MANFTPKKGKGKKDFIYIARTNLLKDLKVTNIDWKDTELLKNFITDRGKIKLRVNTGVSIAEQRKIARAIKNAREMALLPYSTNK